MQRIMGYMRKAIQEYGMIEPGDRIAVGISGGKDSIALAAGLAGLQKFIGIPFQLVGVTLDPGWNGQRTDYGPIGQMCESMGMAYHVLETEIGPIVFEAREESNPCSLCARMRRGALHDAAKQFGCNKIALGHHYDDAVETFVMNLFHEGRVGCFSPVTYLSRKDLTMIRPLIFAPEREIASAVRKAGYPISAVTELKGIQDAGLLPKGDKWYISKMTKVLTQMCNEAYAQGQIDGKGEEN